MKTSPKTTIPLLSLLHRLNFPPRFLCLFSQQFRGVSNEACSQFITLLRKTLGVLPEIAGR